MGHIREIYAEFDRRGARVVAIMAESYNRMHEFLETHEYPFPLLSDVRREAVRAYGVYVKLNFESVNISRPAEVILDDKKTVGYIYIGRIQTDFPDDEEIFAALDALSTSEGPEVRS
ncbi:MAG: peroxiredoxin family protein [Actinobacteria bacterium]|nr:peroxiredoxin family protein [Actinomycetota bacterium]MBU1945148.1 peroxiredoxin family protein [Actinomycetota bacterium]MBU2686402.1 peroxiredoxin family protein [Actinomycetota bacterium]